MKGMIVEQKGKYAAVLADDGVVYKVLANNYQIGEVICLTRRRSNISAFIKWGVGFAAAFAIMISGVFAYFTPTAYVTMDVNPSFEFAVNTFERVIEVKAINQDAQLLLAAGNCKNMAISRAIAVTTEMLITEGYITDDDGGIILAASMTNPNKAERMAERLRRCVQQTILSKGKKSEVDAVTVDPERAEEARRRGVTAGKLDLVDRLKASADNPEEINIDEWLNKSIKDINEAILIEEKNREQERIRNDQPEVDEGPGGNSEGKHFGNDEGEDPLDNNDEEKQDPQTENGAGTGKPGDRRKQSGE